MLDYRGGAKYKMCRQDEKLFTLACFNHRPAKASRQQVAAPSIQIEHIDETGKAKHKVFPLKERTKYLFDNVSSTKG